VRTKATLRALLHRARYDEIAAVAVRQRRILGTLLSLTFDADPQIRWRAVEAMGIAAARIADDDPDYVREHLRRLYWLISEESGGVCWHAPEALAEIVRHRPLRFADYVPIIVFLIRNLAEEDLDHFRAGVLWAIGRLGSLASEYIDNVEGPVVVALDDPDPQVRGMAVWCLRRVGRTQPLSDRPDLLVDEEPVDLYEDGCLNRTRVCDLTRRALGD
jgi:hypothetical protein